jgi:Common central domain of tyrosinase/Polyphenol oxidase middle domain
MKAEHHRGPSRRRFLRGAAALAGGSIFASSTTMLSSLRAYAQDPPSACPTPPSGGTHFVPGSDTRPIILRKSASALTPAELTKLQSAYAALRALPASDKRTWILQADMHALFCDSCNNSPQDIHGSWQFFPWHRAYLYYYERILGSLVGDLNNFRIPYWDWENVRTLPPSYRSPGSSANPLWDGTRNSGMAGGGNLPSGDGTVSRINTLDMITDFATFGGTASFGGALENDPHGTIHMDVGQSAPPFHDMGNLGYAARDPLFFAHHCNIDKLWSAWNELAGGTGLPPDAYKNPSDPAFLNTRWSFYDENQQVVSISAGDVLKHEANLRYTYKPRIFRVPPLQLIWICKLICCLPGPDPGPILEINERFREQALTAVRQQSTMLLVLQGVAIPPNATGVFEVLSVRGDRRIHLGSIGIVPHGDGAGHAKGRGLQTVVLDITSAANDLLAKDKPATLRVIARPPEQKTGIAEFLRPGQKLQYAFELKAEHAEIRAQKR